MCQRHSPAAQQAQWLASVMQGHAVPDSTQSIEAKNLPPETRAEDSYDSMRLVFAADRAEREKRIIKMAEMSS